MKFDKKICNVLATGVLAGMLTLNLGTASAFANGNATTGEEAQSNEEVQAYDDENTSHDTTVIEESDSSLVPGDFFYFLKVVVERIEVALTFDDIEKAKLIASFAEERIKEASVLLAEGKVELASEVLEKALKQQEMALSYSTNTDVEVETETETEGSQTEGAEESTEESSEADELKTVHARNVAALTAVLNKIDNETAKAAIAKNIEKLSAKMDKQSKKLAKAEVKYDNKVSKIEAKVESGQISKEKATTEIEIEVETEVEAAESSGAVKTQGKKEEALKKTEEKKSAVMKKVEEKQLMKNADRNDDDSTVKEK